MPIDASNPGSAPDGAGAPFPELLPCGFCGADADVADDTDGSFYLEVFHAQDCPAVREAEDAHACWWFYPEDFEEPGAAKLQVAAWWNRRAVARPACTMRPVEIVDAFEVFECSLCGGRTLCGKVPRFCPDCGSSNSMEGRSIDVG